MCPIEQESIVDGGKEIVKEEKDGVKVVATYDGQFEQYRHSEGAWRTAQVAETVVQVAQVKRVIDHTNYYSRMERLDRQAQVWSKENFRTTTLSPHTSMRGGVFLETNSRAKYVVLKYLYSLEKEPLSFLFEQWFQKR